MCCPAVPHLHGHRDLHVARAHQQPPLLLPRGHMVRAPHMVVCAGQPLTACCGSVSMHPDTSALFIDGCNVCRRCLLPAAQEPGAVAAGVRHRALPLRRQRGAPAAHDPGLHARQLSQPWGSLHWPFQCISTPIMRRTRTCFNSTRLQHSHNFGCPLGAPQLQLAAGGCQAAHPEPWKPLKKP